MSVIIINPNSTESMTNAMLEQARRAAPNIDFEGWTSFDGPPAIQGPKDGAAATPPFLELVKNATKIGAEGIIIGCFDDTGLKEAAKSAECPVIGIGQASYHFAALRQWRFSVVTTLAVSIPIIEANIQQAGLSSYVSRVRASDVPVLELEAAPTAPTNQVLLEARVAQSEDAIDALILGCAGMVHLTKRARAELQIRVVDPVTCAAKSMRWLV